MSMFHELMMKKKGMPSRYQEVEYIESTGTQYIDTGYVPTNDTYIETYVKFSGTFNPQGTTLFGVVETNNRFSVNFGSSSSDYGNIFFWVRPYVSETWRITNGSPTSKEKIAITSTQGIWGNKSVTLPTRQSQCQNSMILFGYNNNGTINPFSAYNMQIHDYFKIFEDSRLVRNFIPVYDTLTQKYGMWESVQRKFYGNDGTGDFGGSIVGYTIVGSPTIVDGVVSGFDAHNYIASAINFNTSNLPVIKKIEQQVKVIIGGSTTTQQINGITYNIGFDIYITKFRLKMPNNIKLESSVSATVNTTFWLKMIYNDNDIEKTVSIMVSTDKINWVTNTLQLAQDYSIGTINSKIQYGNNGYGKFNGSIDFNETYFKINNKLWFNGQQA